MSNAVYPLGLQYILGGDFDSDTADVRAILIDTGTYTYSSAHDFLNDVTAGARIAVSGSLTSVTKASGVLDAADTTITGVSGATVEAVIVYKHTGTESTSALLSFHDGLSLTPDGGNVVIQWNASGIFSI